MKKLFKQDLAEKLRIGFRHVERLMSSGEIPPADGYEMPGGSYWLSTPEFRAFIREHRRPPRRK